MKKIHNYLFCLLIVLISLNGCQSAKEAISMQKRNNTDEFLVKKKDPLVIPPKFDELPEPNTAESLKVKQEENFDIKKILGKASSSENTKVSNDSLKKSIMKKINKN